jgi:hypothetical protein
MWLIRISSHDDKNQSSAAYDFVDLAYDLFHPCLLRAGVDAHYGGQGRVLIMINR